MVRLSAAPLGCLVPIKPYGKELAWPEVRTVTGWSHADDSFERLCEMALIVKARRYGNVGEALLGFEEFAASESDSVTPDHLSDGATIVKTKLTSQGYRMDPNGAGNIAEW